MHQQGKIVNKFHEARTRKCISKAKLSTSAVMQALENASQVCKAHLIYLHFTNFSWIFVFPSPLSLLPTEYPVLVFQSVNQVYMFNIISIILCDIQY